MVPKQFQSAASNAQDSVNSNARIPVRKSISGACLARLIGSVSVANSISLQTAVDASSPLGRAEVVMAAGSINAMVVLALANRWCHVLFVEDDW
jgi:hypothetical protein